ncbi:MAG: GNAT family N-acetyltransferase [Saprospiraceae bacterium]
MKSYETLETKRLTLRATNIEDKAFILVLYNTPNWIKYIGDRNIKTIFDSEKYIEDKILPQYHNFGYGNYTLIRKSDNIKIGTCGLYKREGLEGIDIGFSLLSQYEGQGYAYEAASTMLEFAINELKIEKLQAITTENNLSSQKLIKKLGLKYIKKIFIPNDEEELMLYEY